MLLVEDDELLAALFMATLEDRVAVTWVTSGEDALIRLGELRWDLLIADIELPGMNGIEMIRTARETDAHVAALVLSSHASFSYAVEAIRAGADDYLTKPADPEALRAKVDELVALSDSRRAKGHEVVLAIGAHPDDVEIGCGGILLRHVAAGHDVSVLTLTGGEAGGIASDRALEARRAADLMGVRLFLTDLQDTSVSESGSTIQTISRVLAETGATTIYTHTAHDVHQDHRNVYRATRVAARQTPRLFCYQAPSSGVDYQPSRFVEIDDFLERKLEVIRAYTSQVAIRGYLEEDLLRATARYWGRFTRARYVEPLEVVRDSDVAGGPPAVRREPDNLPAEVPADAA